MSCAAGIYVYIVNCDLFLGWSVLVAGATRLPAGDARHDAVVAHASTTRVRFLGHVVAPFVTLVAGEVLPGLVVLTFSNKFHGVQLAERSLTDRWRFESVTATIT